jgi:hypothetical protein
MKTKKEVLNDIIYDLKMSGSVDFEVDNFESFNACELVGGGYCFQSQFRYLEVRNLTEARKEISKFGQKLLWL